MFDMAKMMKKAQDMQNQMKEIQSELERTEFTGTAGNGAVTVTCNGKHEFLNVSIKDEAMGDREMLEDLLLAALKDASGKVATTMEEKMGAVTAGLNMPGLNIPGF